MTATTALAACPQCNPLYPESDGEGGYYSCYFCCDTGTVPADVAASYWQSLDDAAEQFIPKRLGMFPTRASSMWDWDCDNERELSPGHRLFTRFPDIANSIRIEAAAASRAAFANCIDDIPF